MAASHIQVAPDSTGKDVDADSITSSESGTPTVYRQNVILSDPTTYANKAGVTAAGAVKVDPSGVTAPVITAVDNTSTYAPSNVSSTAYEASHVVKSSAGVLFSMTGHNSANAGQFIQFHNATSLPADTAVPVLIFFVPSKTSFSLDFGGKFGRYFSTGIVVCNSSTGPTKTIGAANCWFDVQYS